MIIFLLKSNNIVVISSFFSFSIYETNFIRFFFGVFSCTAHLYFFFCLSPIFTSFSFVYSIFLSIFMLPIIYFFSIFVLSTAFVYLYAAILYFFSISLLSIASVYFLSVYRLFSPVSLLSTIYFNLCFFRCVFF